MEHNEIFIQKPEKGKPGLNVGLIMGKPLVKGEVGLEIEVEGKKLPHEDQTPAPWVYHHDGSLRGQENAEYVLAKPVPFDKVGDSLVMLWKAFKTKHSVFDDSNRTSVHVHLNVQEWHLNRLTAFLACYFALEEILTEWCGEYRVGNLFCLRAIDAPAIVSWTKRFIRSDGQVPLPETLHYAGLNTNALKKFGSLEIRTLRGTSDQTVIKQWVDILKRLYDISADFEDPRDICTMVSSGGGPLVFFDTILGDMAGVVRAGVSMTDNDIRDSIYTGIRLAQDICYCRDWSIYNPLSLKPDPFGRNMKTRVKKIITAVSPLEATNPLQALMPGGYVTVSSSNGSPIQLQVEEYLEPEEESGVYVEPEPFFDPDEEDY